MKLVSSTPEPKHNHRVKPDRSWFWARMRSHVLTPRYITSLAWLLLVVVVAVFAFSIFHMFRQMLELSAGAQ